MDEKSSKPWDAKLAYKLVYPFRNTALSPNQLTTLRLIVGIAACLALSNGDYIWMNLGAVLFCLSNFLDHADGELARITGKASQSGHYYDLASDALVNILLFLAIGIDLTHSQLGIMAFPMGCIAGLSVAAIFHMRNKIEQSLGKSDARQPNLSVIEAEDVLYLLPIITLADQSIVFLSLASVGAPLFAIWVAFQYFTLKRNQ